MMRALTLIACLSLAAIPAAASDVLTGVVDPYLRIQTSLASDSMDGIKEDAAAIAAAAGKLGDEAGPLNAAAVELKKATDLATARAAFWKLSEALIAYADGTRGQLGAGNTTAYCPMEKKYWVQKEGPIANPYAGKKMPRCGELKTPPKGSKS